MNMNAPADETLPAKTLPPLLDVRNLVKHYPTRTFWRNNPPVKAVDGISFCA